MKRKLLTIALGMVLLLLLTGCFCQHEWAQANCTSPSTCALCGETEGAPLGHSWVAATCTDPKACENCGQTEGEAKGHSWADATCLVPEKCSLCHETRGAALSHDWEEATTEAPKTCRSCQGTEGNRLITDPRFTTASTKHLQGKWSCDVVFTGDMIGTEGYLDELACTVFFEFGSTGEMSCSLEIHDRFAFMDAAKKAATDNFYASMADAGYSKSEADAEILTYYGMTMEEYIDVMMSSVDLDELFGLFNYDGVYYVGNEKIYVSESWYDEFVGSEYTLENGVLIMQEMTLEEGGEPLQFTPVEKA